MLVFNSLKTISKITTNEIFDGILRFAQDDRVAFIKKETLRRANEAPQGSCLQPVPLSS
jgi:hypothetical protein